MLCMSSLPASIKKIGSNTTEKRWRRRFPHISQWGISVAMETRVLIQSAQKPYADFPLPRWCYTWNLIKIGQLASEIFKFECVDDDGRTDGRRPLVYYKLTMWAFGTEELRIRRYQSLKCQRPFSSKSRMQFTIWYPSFCQQFPSHRQKMLPNKHKTRFRNKSLFSDIT